MDDSNQFNPIKSTQWQFIQPQPILICNALSHPFLLCLFIVVLRPFVLLYRSNAHRNLCQEFLVLPENTLQRNGRREKKQKTHFNKYLIRLRLKRRCLCQSHRYVTMRSRWMCLLVVVMQVSKGKLISMKRGQFKWNHRCIRCDQSHCSWIDMVRRSAEIWNNIRLVEWRRWRTFSRAFEKRKMFFQHPNNCVFGVPEYTRLTRIRNSPKLK